MGSKSNFISTGTKTITGAHQMECKAGGLFNLLLTLKAGWMLSDMLP
jgi:hypothetical protein